MKKVIRSGLLVSLLTTCVVGPTLAASSDWPQKPITVVVPFAPGGGGDTLARMVTNQVVKDTGWNIIIDNKPGAGGNIGTASVARSTPDGYTIAYGTLGTHGTNYFVYKDTGYKPEQFKPITRFTTITAGFTVNKDSKYKSVADVIEAAKKDPGSITCGSAGNATTSHIACEMFKQQAGVDLQHVPYKGGGAALTDLIAGRIDVLIDVAPNISPMVRSGDIRLLAVTSDERIKAQPNTPTMKEAGLPDYSFLAWDGLFAPEKIDPEILLKLNTAFNKALQSKELTEAMLSRGADTAPLSLQETADFVLAEQKRLKDIVEKSGAKIN